MSRPIEVELQTVDSDEWQPVVSLDGSGGDDDGRGGGGGGGAKSGGGDGRDLSPLRATGTRRLSRAERRRMSQMEKLQDVEGDKLHGLRLLSAFAFADDGYRDRIVRRQDKLALVLAVVGILLQTAEYAVIGLGRVPGGPGDDPYYGRTFDGWPAVRVASEALKGLVSLTTVVLMYHIVQYYRFQVLTEAVKRRRRTAVFWPSKLKWFLAVELVICGIHPIPLLTHGPLDKLGILMMLRIYLLGRYLRDRSAPYIYRREVRASAAHTSIGTPKFNTLFAFKVLFDVSSLRIVIVSLAGVAVMSALAVHVLERDTQEAFNDLFNCLYFAIITMVAVGYGDYSAVTVPGRIVAMLTGLLGVALASLFVAVLTKVLMLKMHQRHAVDWVAQRTLATQIRLQATLIIQRRWRLKRAVKDASSQMAEIRARELGDMRAFRDLHRLRSLIKRHRLVKIKSGDVQMDMMSSMHDRLATVEQRTAQIDADLKSVLRNQAAILERLDSIAARSEPSVSPG